MHKTNTLTHICSVLLCSLILFTSASCSLSVEQQTEPDMQSSPFQTNLTKKGRGIVRDVEPLAINLTAPISATSDFDIRYLNCPAYLKDDQLQALLDAIPNVTFNTKTVWPEGLPAEYDYSAILEAGKNPGLGVKALHDEGITGKGISIAIIDQTLLTDHTEYKNNLALYEEIHVMPSQPAVMHGCAVASIAVGKTCGVAPDANLFYWAVNFVKDPTIISKSDSNIAFADGLAVAVDRMLEINAALPEKKKIRVLSIMKGFSDLDDSGVKVFLEAIERAKEADIFVITTTSYQYYDFISFETDFGGLGKIDLYGNPDELSTYTLGNFAKDDPEGCLDRLLVPMDARTTADPCGTEDYVFYANGGLSWVAPYFAGLYALAAQVNPDITPELFWSTALNTSNKLTVTINDSEYTLNHVVNPKGLIDALK